MHNNFTSFKLGNRVSNAEFDTLRIGYRRVTGSVTLFKFKDADTNQFVYFMPTFDITGYGETEEKALEMAKFSLNEYFLYLTRLSNKKRDAELSALGFKRERLRQKEFSKAIVDVNGELQNFNAADGKVERLTLEAA